MNDVFTCMHKTLFVNASIAVGLFFFVLIPCQEVASSKSNLTNSAII